MLLALLSFYCRCHLVQCPPHRFVFFFREVHLWKGLFLSGILFLFRLNVGFKNFPCVVLTQERFRAARSIRGGYCLSSPLLDLMHLREHDSDCFSDARETPLIIVDPAWASIPFASYCVLCPKGGVCQLIEELENVFFTIGQFQGNSR